MKLRIDIAIEGGNSGSLKDGYGNLRMMEEIEFPALSFLEICEILGRFQELARRIREGANKR